jgi:hypothetical protein
MGCAHRDDGSSRQARNSSRLVEQLVERRLSAGCLISAPRERHRSGPGRQSGAD